jgi:hypothetical protein
MKKIRRVKRTFRAECDRLAYEDEDGEEFYPRAGQWVEIRKKTSGRDYAAMMQFGALEHSDNTEEIMAAMPELYELLGHKIVAWNWTDIWGDDPSAPLPEPTADAMAQLDFETDIVHLIGLVVGDEETEKNSPSPS